MSCSRERVKASCLVLSKVDPPCTSSRRVIHAHHLGEAVSEGLCWPWPRFATALNKSGIQPYPATERAAISVWTAM